MCHGSLHGMAYWWWKVMHRSPPFIWSLLNTRKTFYPISLPQRKAHLPSPLQLQDRLSPSIRLVIECNFLCFELIPVGRFPSCQHTLFFLIQYTVNPRLFGFPFSFPDESVLGHRKPISSIGGGWLRSTALARAQS